mgnify:CR=1 FL=1
MKKKISIFCSLLLALQMMLSLAVVPAFADEELTSAVYEERRLEVQKSGRRK